MNINYGPHQMKDLPTYLNGQLTSYTITKKIQHKYSLKAIHLALKDKQYFKLLKTVVYLNIDYCYRLLYYMKQSYLVLLKSLRQVKGTQINN